jgi:hypothetical protein
MTGFAAYSASRRSINTYVRRFWSEFNWAGAIASYRIVASFALLFIANGIVEVTGSIPVGSTNWYNSLGGERLSPFRCLGYQMATTRNRGAAYFWRQSVAVWRANFAF